MPKKLLTGTLEEQCAFLYGIAAEKMAAGNYTGAHHALREIAKYAPEYKDVPHLLAVVGQRRTEQRLILLVSLTGAVIFVGLAGLFQLPNDAWKLAAAAVGLLVGFGVANLLMHLRTRLPV